MMRAHLAQQEGMEDAAKAVENLRREMALRPNETAAALPADLWVKIWDNLDNAFFPDKKHPEINMPAGCKCGKTEWKVEGTLTAAFNCHCFMCKYFWSQECPAHTLWVS